MRWRNCSPQSCDSVDVSTSSAWMLSTSPCWTTRPVRMVRAFSASPTVAGSACRPLYRNTRLRGTTRRPVSCDRLLMMLSVMPSVRYSSCRIDARVDERQHRQRLAARARPPRDRRACAPSRWRARAAPPPDPARTRSAGRMSRSTARETIERSSGGATGSKRSQGPAGCRAGVARALPAACGRRTAAAPGQHLVEHAAEREDVAAAVHAAAASPAPATCTRTCRARRPARYARSSGCRRSRPDRSSRCSASPKSRIFTAPSAVRKMFSGFRSRWMTPFACAAASPSAMAAAICTASRHGQRPLREPRAQRLALEQLHDRDGQAVDDRRAREWP